MKFFDRIKSGWEQIANGTANAAGASIQQRTLARLDEMEQAVIVLAAASVKPGSSFGAKHEDVLLEFLDHHFGKKHEQRRKSSFRDHYKMGPQPFIKMACEEIKSLATFDSRIEILKLLAEIAAIENFPGNREIIALKKIGGYLEVHGEHWLKIEQLLNESSPFALLEIEPTTSLPKIKAAYRKMVLKHHPDKHAGAETKAAQRFQEVQRAYEIILQELLIMV